MGRPLYTTVMLTLFILSLLALRGVCAADDLTENEMPSDLLEYQQKQKEELETLEMDSAGEESEVNVTYLEIDMKDVDELKQIVKKSNFFLFGNREARELQFGDGELKELQQDFPTLYPLYTEECQKCQEGISSMSQIFARFYRANDIFRKEFGGFFGGSFDPMPVPSVMNQDMFELQMTCMQCTDIMSEYATQDSAVAKINKRDIPDLIFQFSK